MIATDIKALLMHLNNYCSLVLQNAIGFCVARSHYEITVEHVLFKILEDEQNDLVLILSKLGIDQGRVQKAIVHTLEEYKTGNTAKPVFSPQLLDLIQDAWVISSIDLAEKQVRSGSLLLAFLNRSVFYSTGYYADLFKEIDRTILLKEFGELTILSAENISAEGDIKPMPTTSGSSDIFSDTRVKENFIHRFCTDFTKLAQEGHIDPVFGRDEELRIIIEILARRRKNNPICVGEPGVGKTSIVEGLALRVINSDVPDLLKNVRILGLDMGALEAGAGVKGEFENRLRGVINEIKASAQKIILFIDEAHMLVGAGGAAGGSDAANLLKPALARGELRTIAATTWKEYKKYFEKDPALTRRFQLVKLEEPSVEDAILILRGIKASYEQSHQVMIRDDAIEAAARLSNRYITDRFLPDKAIDLLDTSCARIKINLSAKPGALDDKERTVAALERTIAGLERDKLNTINIDEEKYAKALAEKDRLVDEAAVLRENWMNQQQLGHEIISVRSALSQAKDSAAIAICTNKLRSLEQKLILIQGNNPLVKLEVDPDTVAAVVADWTRVPLGKMQRDESSLLINLEERLKETIKGQDKGLTIISDSIRAAKLGLKNPQQPLAVFLFVGPSGTGKTESSLALADLFFGTKKNVITINMSEFQESHSVSRLIGSPPGYVGYGEGGLLTEAVRQHPYSVVLLDEVEKAHLDVLNIFYQIFDKGVANDGEGKEINFQNTIIILTSNLASDLIQEMTANSQPTTEVDAATLISAINPLLSMHFKPALLARMTVVPFYSLNQEAFARIVEQKIDKIKRMLFANSKMSLNYTPKVVQTIIDRCIEVESGARNIDFLLNSNILPKLSRTILAHASTSAMPDGVLIDVGADGEFSFDFYAQPEEGLKKPDNRIDKSSSENVKRKSASKRSAKYEIKDYA